MNSKWWLGIAAALLIAATGWAADSIVTLKSEVALVKQAQSVQSEKNQAVKEVLQEIRTDQRQTAKDLQEILADIRARANNRR
jgi:esterase/lipase